jgi:transposase
MGGDGRRVNSEKQQQVLDHIAAKQKLKAVATATCLHRNTIAKMRRNLQYCGIAYPHSSVKTGKPAALVQAQIDALAQYVSKYPQAYLSEMQHHIESNFGVVVSVSQVYRALEKLRWSRKVASKAAKERSEPLRHVSAARVQHLYKAEQMVAADGTACNERTGDRKYAWSPINTPVELVYSMKRSE